MVSADKMQQLPDSDGVYFRGEDYAGFWRRLFVDLADIVVVVAIAFFLSMLFVDSSPSSEQEIQCLFFLWSVVLFVYFVLLKRTRFGTLGYLMGNVRIVNLKGEVPKLHLLTLRLLIAIFGPLSFPLDLLWLAGDDHKQALRDKFAQTYVIRKNALPAGVGKVFLYEYDLWSWRVLFREVRKW